MATEKLSKYQRAVLEALNAEPDVAFTLHALAEAVGTSPEGVAQTAISLAHRGLVERIAKRHSLVLYRAAS